MKNSKKYKTIVWDWNGTLLNDVEVGHRTLNRMLEKRNMKTMTLQQYKDWFGFPVEDFYKVVGFDMTKESMHELSVDFVDTYEEFAGGMALTPGVAEVLEDVQKAGVQQYILSALREDLLQQMIVDFNIKKCFEQACGSDNIYAAGKVERGRRMVELYGIKPEETLMVGDTTHDAEVAKALGFDCMLYSGGHNSEWRLKEVAPVISEMEQLLTL